MKAQYSSRFSKLVFGVVCLLVAFTLGGIFALKEYPPFNFLQQGYSDTRTLIKELTRTRHPLVTKQVYSGDGAIWHKPEQTFDGLTLLQGIFSDGLQVKLIDMEGKLLHTWALDFFKIWPEPTHLTKTKIPKSSHDYHSQGVLAMSDGSIIVNFGYLGTAKLDVCGKVLWTVDRMTRHFVTPTVDGNYWIGANREIDDIPEELLFFDVDRSWLKTTYQRYENTMLLVDPAGEILEEVSVLQAFYDAGLEGHIFDAFKITKDDLTHHNNVEVVTRPLADKIIGVEEGDLLLSIRNMNMLIILDKESYSIKWSYSGSWTRQHDPDITPDGKIVVFNNSRSGYGFDRVKGSSIVELDPETSKTRVIYPQKGNKPFYSRIFGTQQLLPNGNIFISEGLAGRVFEVDQHGDVVWEHISRYDESHAAVVEEAYRIDPSFFKVKDWNCKNTGQQ